MNRRQFFSFLGIGAASAIAAPKMLDSKQIKMSQIGMRGEPITESSYYANPSTCVFCYVGDNPQDGQVASYVWKNPTV